MYMYVRAPVDHVVSACVRGTTARESKLEARAEEKRETENDEENGREKGLTLSTSVRRCVERASAGHFGQSVSFFSFFFLLSTSNVHP